MNMRRINYFFPQQMLDRLKILSGKTGLPVSEMIRNAVERALKEAGV